VTSTTAVARARLYLVAPARVAAGELARLTAELAAAGVDVIQLREKALEGADLLRVGEPVAAACRDAGIPFIINDRPDVALALDADGVHLGQNDVPVEVARRILGARLVGRSTHASSEIDAESEARHRPDYIAVGPVHATPTKPGRPAVGLDLVRYAAARAALPWFAIGGIKASNLAAVIEAGARRIVVVRELAQAADPVRAAAGLRALLDQAPLEQAS
jgi:thiamine-phosphate pyrophosphorylase